MTRNEKLSQRAKETTEQLLAEGVCLSNGECEITDRVILQALKQVEREVWERVISEVKDRDFGDAGSFEQWCEIQQEELG